MRIFVLFFGGRVIFMKPNSDLIKCTPSDSQWVDFDKCITYGTVTALKLQNTSFYHLQQFTWAPPHYLLQFSSVQFSCSVVSDSLWPHGLQHARPPCPSPTPEACSNSCPLSQWCHPTISSSVVPYSWQLKQPRLGHTVEKSELLTIQNKSFKVVIFIAGCQQQWRPLGK